MKKCILSCLLILLCCAVPLQVVHSDESSYTFTKIDYRHGLSNSAVLGIFQDNEGLMWFGTYDGMNCYDGTQLEVYRSDFSKSYTLSNNVTHAIQQADGNNLWAVAHLGANRFSKDRRQIVANYEFGGDFVIHSNARGDTWALGYDWIRYYNTHHQLFLQIDLPPIENMVEVDTRAFVTEGGDLWLFPNKSGDLYRFSLDAFDRDSLDTRLTIVPSQFHSKPIVYICHQNGNFCFYDADYDLYLYDISRKSKIYIRNIGHLIRKYGSVAGIVPFYEDIVIAFHTNGLMRLRTSKHYAEEVIDRNLRIFTVYNDPRQGVLWVGTDGQGVLKYSRVHSIARNLMLADLSPNLSRPVRSILTDKHGNLWFGTKGDGLLCVKDYARTGKLSQVEIHAPDGSVQSASSYVKADREFQVCALSESRYHNGFWVGTGAYGLCYYSFDDNSLHSIPTAGDRQIADIHAIYEESDSILYLATTAGFGKLTLEEGGHGIRRARYKPYHFFHQQELTLFYDMLPGEDSLLWIGNREKGLVRFNRRTEEYRVYTLSDILDKSVDDILCLHRYRKDRLYVGTTSGLVCVSTEGETLQADYIGREQVLSNDMIHGILEDANGMLWLSTNRGLVKFNPDNQLAHTYYYSGGVQVGEFCDDAYYRCPYTGKLFFGGVDGLVCLNGDVPAFSGHFPDILLRQMMVENVPVNLQEQHTPDKGLWMRGNRLFFSLSFVVPDYASGDNVDYSYLLEGYDDTWSPFSSASQVSYSNVPPGRYLLNVRYKNDVFTDRCRLYVIPVRILPPWYMTLWARLAYVLLAAALLVYVVVLLRKYFHHEQLLRRLQESEKRNAPSAGGGTLEREVFNSGTLIYQYCTQLEDKNLSPDERREKIWQIREAVMSLLFGSGIGVECFRLLSSLHFFIAGRFYMEAMTQEVMQVLKKEGHDVSFIRLNMPEGFSFPVYKNALRCILYFSGLYLSDNCLSEVVLEAGSKDDRMLLTFSSQDEALRRLYEMLSEQEIGMEAKDTDELFRIYTMRRFVLSALRQQGCQLAFRSAGEAGERHVLTLSFEPIVIAGQEGEKKRVLLLEDREEIVWLISALLSDEYTVCRAGNIQEAFDAMRKSMPVLFLVDMLMYAGAEATFIKYVRKNRSLLSKTVFIPMLTWKVSTGMQRDLLLWADSYVVLPYDIPFLKELVHKSVYGKQEVKQLEVEGLEGWGDTITCSTKEQADFIRRFQQVVEQNIAGEELNVSFLAEQMNLSTRQFYRKIKEISGMSPSDLVRDYRMEMAASLLREHKDLPVNDVIDKVGISSRAYFYKEFTRKFGMTPKEYRESSQAD